MDCGRNVQKERKNGQFQQLPWTGSVFFEAPTHPYFGALSSPKYNIQTLLVVTNSSPSVLSLETVQWCYYRT